MFYNFRKTIEVLNKTERYLLVAAVFVLLLSLFLLGVSTFYKRTVMAPVGGGQFNEGVVGQPILINPLIVNQNKRITILSSLFLATSWIWRKNILRAKTAKLGMWF